MSRVSQIHVNGATRQIDAEDERTLLSVLRDDLELTGCKYGCGEGQCGACTVLIDGIPTRSCKTAIGEVGAGKVATVESIEGGGKLHPIQNAFIEADALQCGYCTSGMIVSSYALLQKNPDPTDDDIIHFMNGHICRCGVYQRIMSAIKLAAKNMREART
ncbi:MAG TPA: (2Fe-2S)-binding protein [Chthoniobacteraceae bacterium]|jgi:aerobic-type carbon monoxide dehydrogenase small subunit (CoxS/CutS family)